MLRSLVLFQRSTTAASEGIKVHEYTRVHIKHLLSWFVHHSPTNCFLLIQDNKYRYSIQSSKSNMLLIKNLAIVALAFVSAVNCTPVHPLSKRANCGQVCTPVTGCEDGCTCDWIV